MVSKTRFFTIALLLLFILFSSSLLIGRYNIFSRGFSFDEDSLNVVYGIRLPRIIIAVLVGLSLGVSGAVMQSLFRNPLAGPSILGVSQGSAVGAAIAILLGLHYLYIHVLATATGLLAVLFTWVLASSIRYGGSTLRLVLAGIAVSAFASAIIGLIKYLADPYDKLPQIVFWLMGSLAGTTWAQVTYALPLIIAGAAVVVVLRWTLNVLALGDDEARALGVNVKSTRLALIVASTLVTATATSVAGVISWIGLLSPHITRRLIGYDNRWVIPGSAIIGALLLLVCDDIARSIIVTELPLGVVTSFLGAPLFMAILRYAKPLGGERR